MHLKFYRVHGALVALIVGGTVWAATIQVPINVSGSGILLEPGGMLEVTSGSRSRFDRMIKRLLAT